MNTTPKTHTPSGCGREEELISYLYDEASPAERAAFERHLDECAACRHELLAFERVRHDLSAWQLPLAPRVEIAPQRGKLELLRELLGLFPIWAQALTALGTVAALALVAIALTGTSIRFGKDSVMVSSTSTSKATAPQPTATPMIAQALTPVEIKAIVDQAVAQAQAQAQENTRAQLASLEARLNAAHEAKLVAVKAQLRTKNRETLALATKQEPTIREWLFAGKDVRETWGTENEKNN